MLLVVFGILLVAPSPSGAQEPSDDAAEQVRGTLLDKKETRESDDDTPVEGVEITVSDEAGTEIGATTSAEDGTFQLGLPGPGRYTAVLAVDTLPDGLELEEGRETLSFEVRPDQAKPLTFTLGGRTRAVTTTFDRVLQLGFAGIRFGFIIAITSVGLSLIFGTTGLTNFMHGELVTFGALIAWFINVQMGLHLIPATLLAMVVGGAAGVGLDASLWRPLRRRGMSLLAMMVVSIGLSLALRNVFQFVFGESPRPYAQYAVQRGFSVGPVNIAPKDLFSIGIALVVLLSIAYLLQRTRIGKAMRAVSDNPDLAASSGIDVDRVIAFVWGLGALLATLGGVLYAANERIRYDSGFTLLLLMFAGITLGGLGSAYGALVGSFLVGLFVNLSTIWVSPELKNVSALVLLIGVLLVRPQGILGTRERVG